MLHASMIDAYHMPRIDKLLGGIGQARYSTILDRARGYWQMPVEVESWPKTAFTTPKGLYQFYQ